VEWVELHRMFGVSEFNIYNGSISSNMSSVFKYYSDRDVLRVFPMPPPINEFSERGAKLGSPASLNDCMMRNWYRYRYMIVIDFDEVIIPGSHDNYTSMLSAIDVARNLTSPWRSYTFRNVYHFDHFPVDASQPEHLRTLRHRARTEPSGFLYASKSFIDPKTCLSVFNHFCYRKFTTYKGPSTLDVNTSIAMSHHYRRCHFDDVKCNNMSQKILADDTILKFKPELNYRVQGVLKELNNT
jgi:hypothetical protein